MNADYDDEDGYEIEPFSVHVERLRARLAAGYYSQNLDRTPDQRRAALDTIRATPHQAHRPADGSLRGVRMTERDAILNAIDTEADVERAVRNVQALLEAERATVHARYLAAAALMDQDAECERQFSEKRTAKGNDHAAVLCVGMAITWEHAADRVRQVAGQ